MTTPLQAHMIGRCAEGSEVSEDGGLADADSGIFAVADGVGGRPGGALASAQAVRSIQEHLRQTAPGARLDDACLRAAVAKANRDVYILGQQDPALQGLATTLTAAVVHGTHARIVHVGDSRAYLLRRGRVQQLTHDHTLVADLKSRHLLDGAAADHHPLQNILTRSVGSSKPVEPDIGALDLEPGDHLLFATDGLAKALSEERLAVTLQAAEQCDAEQMAVALMDAALTSPPKDDITVVVVAFGKLGASK